MRCILQFKFFFDERGIAEGELQNLISKLPSKPQKWWDREQSEGFIYYKYNEKYPFGFIYESEDIWADHVEHEVNKFLNDMEQIRDCVYGHLHEAQLGVAIYCEDQVNPGFKINFMAIRKLVGVDIDFDIYAA